MNQLTGTGPLDLPPAFVEPGYEVVPKAEAKALVAYLSSLRTDAPLFSAPVTVPMAVTAATDTNAPAAATGATNTPSK